MGSIDEPEPLKQAISQSEELKDFKGLNSLPTNVDEAAEMVQMLTQKLVNLSSSLVAKDEQASRQAQLAREAIEAREKAQTDYVTLNTELEMILQQKNLAEGRCLQLNGALKSCVDELRRAKDQKNQETLIRRREWEKVKAELEEENTQLKSQLFEAIGEKKALSKSFQESNRSLAEISEIKAKAESEAKVLQVQIDSMHKDTDNFKYEIHILKKELQMRNEEKEHGKKAAEATHKQHMEDVKKIARLESECQRLRGIIRQKLLCPAVIAQMKVEADHVGKKRLPTRKRSANISQEQRKIEALEERLIIMEDETKTLKEALTERTNDLKAARELCARTAAKLSSAEARIEAITREQVSEKHQAAHNRGRSVVHHHPAAVTSASNGNQNDMEVMDLSLGFEGGANNDDVLSSAESWASALLVQLSNLTNEKVSTSSANLQKDLVEDPKNTVVQQEHHKQPILNEINSKLSLIEDNINVLLSKVKHATENNNVIETGYLDETVKFILDAFSEIKHILNETTMSSIEDSNLQVMDMGLSMQGSETSTPEDLSDVEPGETIGKPNKCENDRIGLQHVLIKIMEAFMSLVKSCSHEDGDDTNTIAEMIHSLLQDTLHVTTQLAARNVQKSFQDMIQLVNHVLDLLWSQCGLPKSLGKISNVNAKADHEDINLDIENFRAQVESMNANQADMEKELHKAEITVEKFFTRVAQLEKELNQVMEEKASLAKEMTAEKTELEGKLQAERLNVSNLRNDISLLKEEMQKQVGAMEELQRQVARNEQETQTVKKEVQGLPKEIEVHADAGGSLTEAKGEEDAGIGESASEANGEDNVDVGEISTEARCENAKLEMNASTKEKLNLLISKELNVCSIPAFVERLRAVEAEEVKLQLDECKRSIAILGKQLMALSDRQTTGVCRDTELIATNQEWLGELPLVPASHALSCRIPSIVRHSVGQRQSSFRCTRMTPRLIASHGTWEESPHWVSNVPDMHHQDYANGTGYVAYSMPSTVIISPPVSPLECRTSGPVTSAVVVVASPDCGGIIASGSGSRKSSTWRICQLFSRARKQP